MSALKVDISFRPAFAVHLTYANILPLIVLAEHHYDGVCKAAAATGGFLRGWFNRAQFNETLHIDAVVACPATFRELDTLLKICEGGRLARSAQLITDADAKFVGQLVQLITRALNTAEQATRQLNSISVTQA